MYPEFPSVTEERGPEFAQTVSSSPLSDSPSGRPGGSRLPLLLSTSRRARGLPSGVCHLAHDRLFCVGRSPIGLQQCGHSLPSWLWSAPVQHPEPTVWCPSMWLNLCHFSSQTPSLALRLSPPEAPVYIGGILNFRPRSSSPQPPHTSLMFLGVPQRAPCFYISHASLFSTPSHLIHRKKSHLFFLSSSKAPPPWNLHDGTESLPLLGLGFTYF